MKKAVCLLLIALVTILSLTSCAVHIEDTNGADDFSLTTISNKDIVEKSSYSMISSKKISVNNKTTMTVGTFSGVYVLNSQWFNNDMSSFHLESKVIFGKFAYSNN